MTLPSSGGLGAGLTEVRSGPPAASRSKTFDAVSIVAAIVLVVGAVQLGAGAWTAGITIDEPNHVSRTQNWFDRGVYVPDWLLLDGEPDRSDPRSSTHIYGPTVSWLAHIANVLFGNEEYGSLSGGIAATRVRHLTIAALGLATAAAVALSTRVLTGSRSFALWAAAAMISIPAWMGHSFFNIKDVPSAFGYTLVTTGLVLGLHVYSRRRTFTRSVGAILLVVGVFVGAGTRSALWLPFMASIALFLILHLLLQRRHAAIGQFGLVAVLIGAVVGFALAAASYPHNAGAPLEWLIRSVTGSTGYRGGSTLTAGEVVTGVWWYLPVWVAARLPLVILLLAAVGVLSTLWAILDRSVFQRGSHMADGSETREAGLILVLQQAFLVSLGSIVLGATMYDGLRQHLYVLPALAILAGVGASRVWHRANRATVKQAWTRRVVMGLLVVGLIAPMIEQSLLFPYNYTYVNPIAGIGGVNDRWETDYWFSSAPEAIAAIPSSGDLICTYAIVRPESPDAELPRADCNRDQLAPFLSYRGTSAIHGSLDDSEVWALMWRRQGNISPSYCAVAHEVKRWLRGEAITMSYVLRCDEDALTG